MLLVRCAWPSPACRAVLAIPARPRAARSWHDKAPGGCRGLFEPPLIPRWRQAARTPGMGHIVERCTGAAYPYSAPGFGIGVARGSRSRAHLPGGAHPPADRRRWLCDIVSGLQGHDAYADRAAGCVAGGIKHGHAHTGYMIAAGCCAGPAAAKEETWKAVCLTIPWYQYKPFPYHILSPVFQLLFCDTGRCADTCNASPPRSPPTAGRGCTVDAGFHGRAGWQPG